MRIRDWSSDVCSSDLVHGVEHAERHRGIERARMQQTLRMAERVRIAHAIDVRRLALHPGAQVWIEAVAVRASVTEALGHLDSRLVGRSMHFACFFVPIGRDSCWERVCPIVLISAD